MQRGKRKGEIALAARRLFGEFGYHGVGVDIIAAEAGIGGPGLYRHFRSKQDLLAGVVFDGLAEFQATLDHAAHHGATGLELLAALATASIDQRDAPALWRREVRHMRAEEQVEVTARLRAFEEGVAKAMNAANPNDELTRMRARAVLSVLWSASYHHATPPRREFEKLLAGLAWAVWRTELPQATGSIASGEPQRAGGRTGRASRREMILSVATELFADRGFAEVSVDDVAAVLGVTGASVYRHFASKADLLHTALTRGAEALNLSLSAALAAADTAAEALDLVLASYVDVMLAHRAITQLLLTEVMNLPGEAAAAMRSTQRAYVGEWVHLLREADPDLTADAARVVAHGALGVINDTLRIHRHGGPRSLRSTTLALGLAVVHGVGEHDTELQTPGSKPADTTVPSIVSQEPPIG